MSKRALAYSTNPASARRARMLRQVTPRHARSLRPWSDVRIAGAPLQATSGHPPHIKRWQFALLIAAVLVFHTAIVAYLANHRPRSEVPKKAELSLEIVRPPKPPEPPKVEPPKQPPPPKQARVLPQIQQSDPLPSTASESSEPAVAVAPIVSEPARPPPPPAPEPVTEPIGGAGYLDNPAPEYPALASRQGWQGTVLLHVHVLANGSVESVEIKQSSGRRVLDDEAVRTVKRWSFTPSKRGTTPIDGWATVPIEFLLEQ